jgi:hypothetical protein
VGLFRGAVAANYLPAQTNNGIKKLQYLLMKNLDCDALIQISQKSGSALKVSKALPSLCGYLIFPTLGTCQDMRKLYKFAAP